MICSAEGIVFVFYASFGAREVHNIVILSNNIYTLVGIEMIDFRTESQWFLCLYFSDFNTD